MSFPHLGPDDSVIEFPTMADAEDAIRRLDGSEIQGVPVKLEIATVCIGASPC